MSSRKEYEMLFKLNAQLGANYNSSFKSAQQKVIQMENELQSLAKKQSDIAAYQKQQKAVEETKNKLELLCKQYDNIQKEMSETGNYSADLKNKLLQKQMQIEKTTGAVSTHETKLQQMDGALRQAGIDTGNLARESANLAGKYQDVKKGQESLATEFQKGGKQASVFGEETVNAVNSVQQALAAAGIAVMLKATAEAMKECAVASIDFESGMTGIDKTTDLTAQELKGMSQAIKDLSTEIPITTDELTKVGETAGQLGIEKENLIEFTTIMSELGTATTMTADDAATLLAQIASITQMDPQYYSNLASTIVDLGNKYSTTEQRITGMAQGIASSANLAGMSEADMVALAAAVTSLGFESEMGSTAISKLISDIQRAVDSGDGLDNWAKVAGMSANEFATSWGDNAVGALNAFVTGLGSLNESGGSVILTLSELGITEARMSNVIKALATSNGRLSSTLDTANTAWNENTALTTEAEKRYATTASKLAILQNAYNNMKIAVGDALTPAISGLAEVGTIVLDGLGKLIQMHPEAVKALVVFTATVGVTAAGLVAYAVAAKGAALANKLLSASIPGLNVIMGVTTAIGALAGVMTVVASASSDANKEYEALTISSQRNYDSLQKLNSEYAALCESEKENTAEAFKLQWQIKELSAEYESSKQTVEAFSQEIEDLNEAISKSRQEHKENAGEIEGEYKSTLALVDELSQLEQKTVRTAGEQGLMTAIVKELNTRYEELGLKVDNTTSKLNLSAEAVRNFARAKAEDDAHEENYNAYIAAADAAAKKELQVAAATKDAEIAQREYNEASAAFDEKNAGRTGSGWLSQLIDLHRNEGAAVKDAAEANDYYAGVLEQTQEEYGNCAKEVSELGAEIGIYDETAKVSATSAELLDGAIASTTSKVALLSTEYGTAYNSAYASISGQMGLFETMSTSTGESVDAMITALESQADYMATYSENLKLAGDMGLDEGLLSQLSDGSTKSAAYLQAIASGGKAKIAELNAAFSEVSKGKEGFSDTVAEMETDFSAKMAALQQDFATTVGEMNLSKDAAESGRQTIQGFTNGLDSKIAPALEKIKKFAQDCKDALNGELDIESPSGVTTYSGEMYGAGLIKGLKNSEAETREAVKEYASIPANAFSADYSEIVALSPVLMPYLSGTQGATNVEAAGVDVPTRGSTPVVLQVTYQISGGASDEMKSQLRAHDDELKEMVREVMSEIDVDTKRTAYT